MFAALTETLKWIALDQRRLISDGFGEGEPFQVELFLPDYTSKSVRRKAVPRRRRVVFFWHPDHFSEIHKMPSEVIDTGSAYAFLKPYFGDESVFVASGAGHAPAKQAVYRTIRDKMQIEENDLIFFNYSILERFKSGVYPALKPVQEISAAFLLRTIFEVQGSPEARETIEKAIAAAGNASGTFLILPNVLRWTRRFGVGLEVRRQRLHLRNFILDELNGMGIAHHWKDESAEAARTEIIDNLMTLLIAGFETTSTTIAWLLYELAANIELQADLRSEIHERIQPDPLSYFEDDQTLLSRCVHEALRLHPSIPFIIREVREAVSVGGIGLQPNNYIVLSIDELHRRGFDGGDRFDPSRYLDKKSLPKLATFGGGAKICPGRVIAVQQSRIIVSMLISKFLVETTSKTRSDIIRNRVSATPEGGMILSFTRLQ